MSRVDFYLSKYGMTAKDLRALGYERSWDLSSPEENVRRDDTWEKHSGWIWNEFGTLNLKDSSSYSSFQIQINAASDYIEVYMSSGLRKQDKSLVAPWKYTMERLIREESITWEYIIRIFNNNSWCGRDVSCCLKFLHIPLTKENLHKIEDLRRKMKKLLNKPVGKKVSICL